MLKEDLSKLLQRYQTPGGRYTFYPLLQKWKKDLCEEQWVSDLKTEMSSQKEMDVYIHIPFCPSLCTFCGCNIKISKNYEEQKHYIETVLKELNLYRNKFGEFNISNLYLGGGTPTSLPADLLEHFLNELLPQKIINLGTIESDPRLDHSKTLPILKRFGFSRISLGIQDLDPKVLKNVNRQHSFEEIQNVHLQIIENDFKEVFYDFIYGLPFQTEKSFLNTLEKILTLKPSGLSLYPLAHVPWQRRNQLAFGDFKPLDEDQKLNLFLSACEYLENNGYQFVGMGHFLNPENETGIAFNKNQLRRHIMGLTPKKSNILLGLGVSSISQSGISLAQNERVLERYIARVEHGNIPLEQGHRQTKDEQKLHRSFEELFCQGSLDLKGLNQGSNKILDSLKNDALIAKDEERLQLKGKGRFFIKNVCQAFDSNFN